MERTTEALKAERSSLYLVDKERSEIWTKVAQELGSVIRQPIGVGISGRVAQTGETLNIPDAWEVPYFNKAPDVENRFRTKAVLCMPIRTRLGEIIGVLQVINKQEGLFTLEDERLLTGIASHAAIALENAKLYRENAQLREDALRAERLAAIGQTIAGLAHCVKNILNGIQGGSYILEGGLRNSDLDRLSRGWEMVKRNNTFMHELVLDMLTYAKDRQPEYASTDVNALCRSVCELTAEKARENGVEIGRGLSSQRRIWKNIWARSRRLILRSPLIRAHFSKPWRRFLGRPHRTQARRPPFRGRTHLTEEHAKSAARKGR